MIELKKTLKNFLVKRELLTTTRERMSRNVMAENGEAAEKEVKSNSCCDVEKSCDRGYSDRDILNVEETITIEEVK